MGPTWMRLEKPVTAAVEGHAVAGGLELAIWCDLCVAARNAVFGVFCRRFGVPLIDGGTVRLPRLIGVSRALDLILTGRAVGAEEAHRIGLVNRLVEPAQALAHAVEEARALASLPQRCLRSDRLSVYEQMDLPIAEALRAEIERGRKVIACGEAAAGASSFTSGEGRHGQTRRTSV
jgi:enoyl-CoA hydratase